MTPIGLGEDGPTHQPVEQTATLRYIPNMDVWRPCDSVESAVAWARAIERKDGPSALIFSRQSLPFQKRNAAVVNLINKGGYIFIRCSGQKTTCHHYRYWFGNWTSNGCTKGTG